MEFLKDLWLQFLTIISYALHQETPNQKELTLLENQEQKTELKNDEENDARRMFNGALSTTVQAQLFIGIEQANHTVIEHTLKHGADINTPINGLDPLQYAIRHEKDYIIEFLLEKGATIRPEHIQLAQSYQMIYESNLEGHDLIINGDKIEQFQEKIRHYHMISNYLQQEMRRREQRTQQATMPNTNNPAPKAGGGASARA